MDAGTSGRAGAVKRIDFATDDRGVAAAAIEDEFGFRTRINGRRVDYRQLTVANEDVSFTELRFGGDLRTDADPNPSFVVSEVPRGRYLVRRGRETTDLSHGGLFLLPTGCPMTVELDHTVTRTHNLGAVEQVRQIAWQVAPESAEVDLGGLLPVSAAAERYLRESMALYRRHFLAMTAGPGGLAAEQAHRHLVVTAMTAFGLIDTERRDAPATAALSRARAWIAEHLADPVTIADIAAAAGTGVRSLQITFRREVGLTPMEYLRDARLATARTELTTGIDAASGEPPTVAAVALRWGFSNAGRFSSAYRRRFGEYPSDTLRRR